MNKEMLVIPTDGVAEYRQVPTGYPALNQAVLDGGYMQEMRCVTPNGEQVVFIMDEEGKFKNLQPNLAATGLWYGMGGAQLMPGDVFCGVVAICGAQGEELADIPEWAKMVGNATAAGVRAMGDDEDDLREEYLHLGPPI